MASSQELGILQSPVDWPMPYCMLKWDTNENYTIVHEIEIFFFSHNTVTRAHPMKFRIAEKDRQHVINLCNLLHQDLVWPLALMAWNGDCPNSGIVKSINGLVMMTMHDLQIQNQCAFESQLQQNKSEKEACLSLLFVHFLEAANGALWTTKCSF